MFTFAPTRPVKPVARTLAGSVPPSGRCAPLRGTTLARCARAQRSSNAAESQPRGLQCCFSDLHKSLKPQQSLPKQTWSVSPRATEAEWLEDICRCVRTDVPALDGLRVSCAQATGRVQIVISRPDKNGYPPLAYAIASRSKDAVQLLLIREADPNATAHGFSLLAFAIVAKAERIVQLLLSHGANPFSVPLRQLLPEDASMQLAEDQADSAEAAPLSPSMAERDMQLLASSLNEAICYWLVQATRLPPLTQRMRLALARMELKRLAALRFMLVGQKAALVTVFNTIIVHLMSPAGPGSKKKPLAMLFAGPPGHGKTRLAEELGRLVNAPCLFIDCATTTHVSDMFGCQKPYQGYPQGSELVNFLSVNVGKRCVVVLDEFEKTSEEVHNGFLRVFDGGEIPDWRDGIQKLIDCSQAIFVMTTNAHDRVILKAQKSNPGLHHARSMAPEEAVRLLKPLTTQLKAGNKIHFRPSLASRIAHTIPFIPFSMVEAEVVVSQTLCKLAESLSCAASEPGILPGGIRMEIQEESRICKKLAAEIYSADTGARFLENEVWSRVQAPLYMKWLGEEIHVGSSLVLKPDPQDLDPFQLDLSQEWRTEAA